MTHTHVTADYEHVSQRKTFHSLCRGVCPQCVPKDNKSNVHHRSSSVAFSALVHTILSEISVLTMPTITNKHYKQNTPTAYQGTEIMNKF